MALLEEGFEIINKFSGLSLGTAYDLFVDDAYGALMVNLLSAHSFQYTLMLSDSGVFCLGCFGDRSMFIEIEDREMRCDRF